MKSKFLRLPFLTRNGKIKENDFFFIRLEPRLIEAGKGVNQRFTNEVCIEYNLALATLNSFCVLARQLPFSFDLITHTH